jgi:hypothetical protein
MLALATGAGTASAAAPTIVEAWASGVSISSARLSVAIDPNGVGTTYHLDYIPQSAYEANLAAAKDGFAGGSRVPAVGETPVGSGSGPVVKSVQLSSLAADVLYRYRFIALNASAETTVGPALAFRTRAVATPDVCPNAAVRAEQGRTPPDCRASEMVSPVDKNGGEVAAPGTLAGGGVLQAAAQGGSVTYSSSASFGVGAEGAAVASQYLAGRGPGGWSTRNITAPLYSGSYDTETEGVPYQLFSGDLARGLLLNGRHCRGEATDCAVPNPPLAGTDAPAGFQNYYLRESATGTYAALLGNANAGFLSLQPADFELRLAGSSPDLSHSMLSTCAALTANATEVELGEGCDPAKANLYEHSPGGGLALVNLLPGEGQGTPGAALAAQAGAVSSDGGRVYFTVAGNLYLREGAQTKQVDLAAGGGGTFQTASSNGSIAYFTKAGHLWRYLAAGAGSATDLTPSGGVVGVLGASADGDRLYYQDSGGLRLWHAGATTTVAPGGGASDASNYPPATGTSRVTADGLRLLFVATASLTGYDNKDLNSGDPDSQAYLYDAAGAGSLTCVSCNPTLGRPIGPSTIPGALANGSAPGSIQTYKPRALSADGRRVFFESRDAIASLDTNSSGAGLPSRPDVYQWEAQGTGSCGRAGGCVDLISSGRSADGASFVDASADGSDVFVLTGESLVGADPGSVDLYDVRILGGFLEPDPPIACKGDACQPLPSPPVEPTLTTLLGGPGNPAERYQVTKKKRCKKGKIRRKGFCVKKKANRGKRARR